MLLVFLSLLNTEEDKDKLTYIYNEYYDVMVKIANKYINNIDNSQDIVHDSILKIIKHIDKIDLNEPKKAKNYILTIVKNTTLDYIKRSDNKNLSIEGYEYDEKSYEVPLELLIDQYEYEKLVGYIMKLNDTLRITCQLKFINNLTDDEIAKILNITPKNVGIRIFRGRNQLKKMILEGRGKDE